LPPAVLSLNINTNIHLLPTASLYSNTAIYHPLPPSYTLLPATSFYNNNTNNLKQLPYVPLALALAPASSLTLSEHNNIAYPSQTKPLTAIEREIPRNRPSSDKNRLVAFYEDNSRTFMLPNKTMV
jgi:hypothetical protein